ncbi:MAG: hypothetical protein AAB868_01190 [Patescibacteria group bacterium]
MPKIKNIIIFTVIAVLLILAYIFFIKPSPEQQNLVSSATFSNTVSTDTNTTINQNSLIAKDLLSVLLSVKSIKLNDTIFSDTAFINLLDSSIFLTPSGDEGRANPFAPIGSEALSAPTVPDSTNVKTP